MTIDQRRRRTLATLATAAGAAVASPVARAAALFLPGPEPGMGSGPSRATVAVARREGLLGAGGSLDPRLLDSALGAAIARAAGEPTAVAALRRLFRPRDVVGIKVNTLGGRGVSTRPELALQLAAFLQAAGVAPDRIYIWDRTDRELRAAGYTIVRDGGVRVFGTEEDWEDDLVEWGPSASRFARVLARDLTAVISCAVLKDHGLAGTSLSMKNFYGVVHNPNKLHADNCTPFVPHLVASPLVRGKLRLGVVDATLAQCHGGPGRVPRWAWPFAGVLASTDPVALDTVGWQVLEARRKEVGLGTLASEGREPRYIAGAARLGLGVTDPSRIERVEV
jgi:uncharacterized protein (DUF362 family)